MSHRIDFRCHGTAKEWNGHWAYSDFLWGLIKGRRSFFINRVPHSKHVDLLRQYGFEVLYDIKNTDTAGIGRNQLASRFENMSDDDLTTRGAFIQAVRKRDAIEAESA